MIVPPRDDNGLPDIASLNTWNVACDGPDCNAEAPVSECSEWLIGRSTSYPVYCPRCERRIARRLIREASGRTFRRYLLLVWRWGR